MARVRYLSQVSTKEEEEEALLCRAVGLYSVWDKEHSAAGRSLTQASEPRSHAAYVPTYIGDRGRGGGAPAYEASSSSFFSSPTHIAAAEAAAASNSLARDQYVHGSCSLKKEEKR